MQLIEVPLCLSIAGLVIILFYYFYFFLSIKADNKNHYNATQRGISVIVCARNERNNLSKVIPLILAQEYKNFELIIVNDRSSDGTKKYLAELELKQEYFSHINIVECENEAGKKGALIEGIKHAKHEFIVVTDADCTPVSKNWLALFNIGFADKEIVLGYSPYRKGSGLLNSLIRFDAFLIATQYFSFTIKGIPYMGVGRNLGYKKSLFNPADMRSHSDLKSGDDDLLIQQIAKSGNTGFSLNKDHWTMSIPKMEWRSYWTQKRRHLTTSVKYSKLHKILLFAFPFSLVWFYLFATIQLVIVQFSWTIIIMLLIKLLSQFLVYGKISRYLGEKDLVLFSPILEIISVLYNAFAACSLLLNKKVEWK